MVFQFFKKNAFDKILDFYEELILLNSQNTNYWLALAVNSRTHHGSQLTKELVMTPAIDSKKKDPLFSVIMAELPDNLFQSLFIDNKPIYSHSLHSSEEIKEIRRLFNRSIDVLIEQEISQFKKQLNLGEFSPRQMENEEKALEWLRVSFEYLEKAILESLTNPDFLFQSTFFCGTNPKTKMREIRLITFNLDITFLLLNDHNLRVLIYNKKDGENFENLKPSLMGDYSLKKREIFDQLINLLSVLAKGFHA